MCICFEDSVAFDIMQGKGCVNNSNTLAYLLIEKVECSLKYGYCNVSYSHLCNSCSSPTSSSPKALPNLSMTVTTVVLI